MKFITITLLALAVTACDDGATDAPMDTGEPGVAVSELSKWGLEECPAGLEEVDGYCVAGTVDLQLEIDDCNAVAKCLPPGAHSCGKSVAGGWIDRDEPSRDYALRTPRDSIRSAAYVAYLTALGQSEGFGAPITRVIEEYDADGTSDCLIDAEANVVLDHWKWSKARQRGIAKAQAAN